MELELAGLMVTTLNGKSAPGLISDQPGEADSALAVLNRWPGTEVAALKPPRTAYTVLALVGSNANEFTARPGRFLLGSRFDRVPPPFTVICTCPLAVP